MKKLLTLFCLLLSFGSFSHEVHMIQRLQVALVVSMAFDVQGGLWRAGVKDGYVVVDMSRDFGKTFSSPVRVNPTPQKIGIDGEARPKIAVSPEGYIYLTWTEALKKPFSGYVWFSRSLNKGATFEKPYIVHQDREEITHRFDALNIADDGNITVLWVDKRDLIAAKNTGKPYDGAAIYYAVSNDKGASFVLEKKLADSSCECCRIALTNKPDGTVVAMWRHVFEGSERDHMLAEIPKLNKVAEPKRATFGRWKIDGCPHHGAALTRGSDWGYHLAWFDGGNEEAGKDATLFYARMDGEAWVSSPPKKFGNRARQAGHPALLSINDSVWLVWREKDHGKSQIWLMQSEDAGRNWEKPNKVMEFSGAVDYPQLLKYKDRAYLVLNVENAGLQLLEF